MSAAPASKACLVGLLLGVSAPAAAAWPDRQLYGGAHLGTTIPLGVWDFPSHRPDHDIALSSGPFAHFGARLGYAASPRLGLELGASGVPLGTTTDLRWFALQVDADAVWHLNDDKRAAPFLLGGLGSYTMLTSAPGADIDPIARVGIGYRRRFAESATWRVEGRLATTDGATKFGNPLVELRLGVDLWKGDPAPPPPAPKDTDGDGLLDDDDRCPNEEGPTDSGGCPVLDRDKDGVLDADDACPDTPGQAAHAGCADRDGDGVADPTDACPDVPGLADHDGCVPEEVKAFVGTIEGVYFETGSAALDRRSHAVLDKAVATLREYTDVRLEIQGHTDSQGADAANLALSQARAEAVRAYLVDSGVAGDRLAAKGYGESRPVGDNGTREGRARNRRIEFKMVQ